MLRKLLIIGAFAGASASIPALYQSNPDALDHLLQGGSGSLASEEILIPMVPETKKVKAVASAPVNGRRVRMKMDDTGHFFGDFKLNGRRVRSLVDTGATLVAINQSTARRIGIRLSPKDFKYEVNTANGMTRAAAAKIESLQIGRIFVRDVDAVVLEDTALSNTLIGMSFLQRLESFKIENRTLSLKQ